MTENDSDREVPLNSHFFSQQADTGKLAASRIRKAGHIIGIIRPYLADRKIGRALSIGSSYCLIEEEIQKRLLPEAEFICTDLDEKALGEFEQPGLEKRIMSATELDFPDESFDFIIAHQVLEHINAYPKILEAFRRLCSPGGVIYINVPNPLSPMIGKLPDGEWPRPIPLAILRHIRKKFHSDFMSNTEKYHTGFTAAYLGKAMPEFSIHDLRKARLKQEVQGGLAHRLIDLFPSALLFLPIETNLWCLVKDR